MPFSSCNFQSHSENSSEQFFYIFSPVVRGFQRIVGKMYDKLKFLNLIPTQIFMFIIYVNPYTWLTTIQPRHQFVLIITGVYLHESRVAAESFITYLAVEHARVALHVLREGPARLVELLAVLEQKTTTNTVESLLKGTFTRKICVFLCFLLSCSCKCKR